MAVVPRGRAVNDLQVLCLLTDCVRDSWVSDSRQGMMVTCRLRATCSECQASGRLEGRKGASPKLKARELKMLYSSEFDTILVVAFDYEQYISRDFPRECIISITLP
ncbi:hypothetical protein EVAR_71339_1 [Eumeta japonica]|uniref:Uncharacterized protein n=1 Tax=Eumeta variegata TaxID=151549 RepID=A0A4C2AA94_EUMVA|nr:hypothetical protein EVAR_71339_1 [Eumeta japonica]